DVGGDVYLAVAVDDPDADLHQWHGRYLYFHPDEVEILVASSTVGASAAVAAPEPERPRVLVAGVGNIFLGDDGFGVEVARRLDPASAPAGVKVADFGIRGVHLAYELLEGYDILILIDAVSRGDPPGTVSVIEHAVGDEPGVGTLAAMDAHGMDPGAVLAMAGDLGAHVGRVLVVGCEAADVADGIGLSQSVADAVPHAITAVDELLASLTAAPESIAAPDSIAAPESIAAPVPESPAEPNPKEPTP
ncbi:MAG: hydrogenase maturation protease, partial [Acidimicrobiales bacterium]